jgi:hypothetical protein
MRNFQEWEFIVRDWYSLNFFNFLKNFVYESKFMEFMG